MEIYTDVHDEYRKTKWHVHTCMMNSDIHTHYTHYTHIMNADAHTTVTYTYVADSANEETFSS